MPRYDEAMDGKNWVAALGGHPAYNESGTTLVGSRMSRGGRRKLRAMLWMPVLLATKRMPEIRDMYERLRAKGKTHKQAMIACMRKLMRIVYGVLKSGKPYQAPETDQAQKDQGTVEPVAQVVSDPETISTEKSETGPRVKAARKRTLKGTALTLGQVLDHPEEFLGAGMT